MAVAKRAKDELTSREAALRTLLQQERDKQLEVPCCCTSQLPSPLLLMLMLPQPYTNILLLLLLLRLFPLTAECLLLFCSFTACCGICFG